MRAVGVLEFGGPEALRVVDRPEPQPGPDEVVIRVHAAAVNPTDTGFRAGGYAPMLSKWPPPYIPGMDAAGVIESLGEQSDGRLAIGQPVMTMILPAGANGGAYAEKIVAPAAAVVPMPGGVSFASASTLLMNGLTARLALDTLALTPGDVLAVTGAAGAFGCYVVQLAKADGLTVIADASAADLELVRSLGADHVVLRGEDFAARVRAIVPGGAAAVADGALQNEAALDAVADGGRLAAVRTFEGETARGITVHQIQVAKLRRATAAMQRLRAQAESGAVTLRLAAVLPAAEAPRAHQLLEAGGTRGRLVLDFSGQAHQVPAP
jgi:NADPH2:quinone reductase